MKFLSLAIALGVITTSCASLNSNTVIKPNDSFVLGDNQHGSFKVNLKNLSENELNVYQVPIGESNKLTQRVRPRQTITVKVPENTALVIANASKDTASVNLKVTGDLGLSMQYKGPKP